MHCLFKAQSSGIRAHTCVTVRVHVWICKRDTYGHFRLAWLPVPAGFPWHKSGPTIDVRTQTTQLHSAGTLSVSQDRDNQSHQTVEEHTELCCFPLMNRTEIKFIFNLFGCSNSLNLRKTYDVIFELEYSLTKYFCTSS